MDAKRELEELLSGRNPSLETPASSETNSDPRLAEPAGMLDGSRPRSASASKSGTHAVAQGAGGVPLWENLESFDFESLRVTPEAAAARRKRLMEIRAKKNLGLLRRQSSMDSSEGSNPQHQRYLLSEKTDGGRKAVTERVLRTRELALRARQRQKEKMSTLESDNEVLKQRQETLERENELLKSQIRQITEKVFGGTEVVGGSMEHSMGPLAATDAAFPPMVTSPGAAFALSPSSRAVASPRPHVLSPRRARQG